MGWKGSAVLEERVGFLCVGCGEGEIEGETEGGRVGQSSRGELWCCTKWLESEATGGVGDGWV